MYHSKDPFYENFFIVWNLDLLKYKNVVNLRSHIVILKTTTEEPLHKKFWIRHFVLVSMCRGNKQNLNLSLFV